jgi:hypothetical protein
MRKIHIGLMMLVVLLGLTIIGCAGTPSAASEGNPTLTIVNQTGGRIWYLYISPPTEDTWGRDWLASDQELHNGQSVTVTLSYPLSVHNKYDVMLIDPNEITYSKFNITLRGNDQLIFTATDLD